MASGQLSEKAQQSLGLPSGFRTYSPYPFGGINAQSAAVSIPDNEFVWLENFVKIGDGTLRTLWDKGVPIYTATGNTIVYYAFYNIGTVDYCFVCLSDGSAVQVKMSDLSVTTIGLANTFYKASTGYLPCVKQWGTQYLLICNRNTVNDYWAWDGSLLYTAGTAAPNGVNILSGGFNYSSPPTVTAYGGHGTGLAVTAVEQGGAIVALNITNPGSGYQVGDNVQLAFSGGGSDTSAVLQALVNAGGVGAVSITNPGSGYTTASVVFFGGGGGGATGTAIITSSVASVAVTNGGSGYTSATGSFTGGGGSGATCTITLSSGAVSAVVITNGGSGYTSAPTFVFSGVGGSGATFGSVVLTSGVISGVTITSAGANYTSAPSVTITGDGSGATGVALLQPSGVSSVIVTNGGSGFTSVPLISFVGGGGAGATAVAVLSPTSIASVQVTGGGSGYTSAPTVAFVSTGGGSGAKATAILNGNEIAQIQVTNGGSGYTGPVEITLTGGGGSGAGGYVVFAPTSIASVVVSNSGEFYTSAPTVEVSSGANNSAYATVTLMPYGVSGSAMETYLSRIWIVNPCPQTYATLPTGGQFQVSAAGSFVDFATSDGGVNGLNTDAFLQHSYVNVRQSSGYLYFFGDGSISVVSNVSTGASGSSAVVTTTYNYQNVDPQAGLSFRDALQDFGRSTIFANQTGVYGLYGGTASKISQKLDQIFQNAVFPPTVGAITPTAAIAFIYNVKHFILLLTVQDPDTLAYRNVMLTWNEKDWAVATQTISITQISAQKVGSEYTAYGTDGTSIYPLFQTPSASLVKRLETKQYGNDQVFIQKQTRGVWIAAQDLSAGQAGVAGTLVTVKSGIGVQSANFPTNPSATFPGTVAVTNQPTGDPFTSEPNFQSPYPYFSLFGTSSGGIYFQTWSIRFTSYSPDFVLTNLVMGYVPQASYGD